MSNREEKDSEQSAEIRTNKSYFFTKPKKSLKKVSSDVIANTSSKINKKQPKLKSVPKEEPIKFHVNAGWEQYLN